MTARLRFTEYLDLDLDEEVWRCNRCDAVLTSARGEYKRAAWCTTATPGRSTRR
jgi:acetophenone carboxylase